MVAQSDYEPSALERSIRRAIDLVEFNLSSVRGKHVLLKPNMLAAYSPAMAVTTHPEFVAAAGRIFAGAGAKVWVGDSPNGVQSIDNVWKTTGIREICAREGLIEKPFESAGSIKKGGFLISRVAIEADFIINLPKFKTHSLTVMTLAVKNMFGCICGIQKSAFHQRHPGAYDFSRTCVQIAQEMKPALSIVDGVIAMEGNGPSAGQVKKLGVIAAGSNMYALDWALCQLIGLAPTELDTTRAAIELGLWRESDDIEIAGDPMARLRPESFLLPATYRTGARNWRISKFVTMLIWSRMKAQPEIAAKRCIRCGMCVRSCPVGAIGWKDEAQAPIICKAACISCYCCHEICPQRAIDIKRNLPLRIWQWMSERRLRRYG